LLLCVVVHRVELLVQGGRAPRVGPASAFCRPRLRIHASQRMCGLCGITSSSSSRLPTSRLTKQRAPDGQGSSSCWVSSRSSGSPWCCMLRHAVLSCGPVITGWPALCLSCSFGLLTQPLLVCVCVWYGWTGVNSSTQQ
jgi:hypothetical protein